MKLYRGDNSAGWRNITGWIMNCGQRLTRDGCQAVSAQARCQTCGFLCCAVLALRREVVKQAMRIVHTGLWVRGYIIEFVLEYVVLLGLCSAWKDSKTFSVDVCNVRCASIIRLDLASREINPAVCSIKFVQIQTLFYSILRLHKETSFGFSDIYYFF